MDAAPAFGKEMRAPVMRRHERRELWLVADQHEIVAVALGQARELVRVEAEQRRVFGERRPSSSR